MGAVLFFVGIIIFVCVQTKERSDDKKHRSKNPWKENMTYEEQDEWIKRESKLVQEEGWKKLGL